ncbi:Lnb N-terminal periplasmic domain-containing protein [Labrys neptuniae]
MIAKLLSIAGRLVLVLVGLLIALWGMLALWYRLPFPEIVRYAVPVLWILITLPALYGVIAARWRLALPFLTAFAALLVWWSTILPTGKGDWAPDVSRQFTATVEGSTARLSNVRDFEWRSDTDFTPRWQDRSYDIDTITGVDLFTSYWAGPAIAHVMLSFSFADRRHLAFSVEVRRKQGEVYSAISGFFKHDELIVIAADERDVIRVRSNIRGEDVQLFALRTGPAEAKELFLYLLSEANDLAATPRFYNTATTNCTTVPFHLARKLDPGLPLDWRVLVSGYLPDYLYDIGALSHQVPLSELRKLGSIDARAKAAGDSPDFSTLIRAGVPRP